jgi:phosphate-selective porin OprO/OprP
VIPVFTVIFLKFSPARTDQEEEPAQLPSWWTVNIRVESSPMSRSVLAVVVAAATAAGLVAQDLPTIPVPPLPDPAPTVLGAPRPLTPVEPAAPAIVIPAIPAEPARPAAPAELPRPAIPAEPVGPAMPTIPVRVEPAALQPPPPVADPRTDSKPQPPKPEEKKDPPAYWIVGDQLGMTARWDHGLWVESADKAFRIHPVGRLQVDGAWMTASPRVQFGPGGVGRVDDGVAFRRMRMGVQGTIWEVFDFWIEPDLFNTFNTQGPNEAGIIGNTSATTDVWAQLTHLPWIGNVRFGSVKPAQSMEHINSSRFLDFMERSLMFDAFVGGIDNGFQPGFLIHNAVLDDRAVWQVSATRNQQNIFGFNVGDGEYHYAARGTYLPIWHDDGRELLHVGMSYSHRQLDDRQARYRARTLIRNGPAALATALADLRLAGQSQDMVIPELAMVLGPFNLQAEYLGTWVHDVAYPLTGPARAPRGTAFFQGAYVQALYFLTGESRPYNRKEGVFTRVIPFENFFLVRGENGCLARGLGAWQVGARYSYLDLDDAGIGGGIVHDLTLGLNWFWNPNVKWQFNYSIARRDVPGAVGNGIVQGFGTRFAMDF